MTELRHVKAQNEERMYKETAIFQSQLKEIKERLYHTETELAKVRTISLTRVLSYKRQPTLTISIICQLYDRTNKWQKRLKKLYEWTLNGVLKKLNPIFVC